MGLPAMAPREEDDAALDICVVGAGPHGLAFMTHFLSSPEHLDHFEEHPNNAALYTQSHTKNGSGIRCKTSPHNTAALRSKRSGRALYEHFLSRAASNMTNVEIHHDDLKVLHVKHEKHHTATRVCVLDKCGEAFLRKWDTHFEVLDIPFLRSTTHQHPDPLDLGALSAFAHHSKRYHELIPLNLNADGARIEAFGGPYLRPSGFLFRDFIRGLVKGFRLEAAVNSADLTQVEAMVGGNGGGMMISGFRITYRKRGEEADRVVITRRVILALGHANLVPVPDWAMGEDFPRGRLLHYEEVVSAMAMVERVDVRRHFHSLLGFEGDVSAPLRGMRVVIVGGGQTSVHLAQLAVSKLGCRPTDVTFVARSALRSQPFDVSLEWLSAGRYKSMAKFWSHDHEHRERMLRDAKGGPCNAGSSGASVDGECVDWLRSSGVHVREQCEVLSATWLPNPTPFGGAWKVELWDDLNCNDEGLECDLIWLATGNAMDFLKEPLVRSLRNSFHAHGMEIRTQGKLPVLNQDLSLQLVRDRSSSNEKEFRCDEGVAVHVMGAYAALELGPGALNLMGARAGACRISRSIRNLLA